MSFDIFLACVQNGEISTFPRILVETAFAPFIESRDESSWKLAGCLADVWIDAQAEINGFGVSRPPGDEHPFWQALFDLMRQTPTVLYWPAADDAAVVADESVIAHMPPDMIESVGRPTVVGTALEIGECIRDS
jgi:hypothetical protein